jgi:hypothetical protein
MPLNPNASAFSFNPGAADFVPSCECWPPACILPICHRSSSPKCRVGIEGGSAIVQRSTHFVVSCTLRGCARVIAHASFGTLVAPFSCNFLLGSVRSM